MKKIQKRTCNGCTVQEYDGVCCLGYKTAPKEHIGPVTVEYMPLEPCEKPKTNIDFVNIKINTLNKEE